MDFPRILIFNSTKLVKFILCFKMNRLELQNTVFDLIIVRSPRLKYHPVILTSRHTISPGLCNNIEFVSLDEKLYRSLVVCKHCHMLFNNQRWNREVMGRHLDKYHGIDVYADEDDYDGKFSGEDDYNGHFADDTGKTQLEPINQLDQDQFREKSVPKMEKSQGAPKYPGKVVQPLQVLLPSPVSIDNIIPTLLIKIGHPQGVEMQTGEDGVQDLKLAKDKDVPSESMPAGEMCLQFSTPPSSGAIDSEQATSPIEATISSMEVSITGVDPKPKVGDQVDFCPTLKSTSTKRKGTGKLMEKKGAGCARRNKKKKTTIIAEDTTGAEISAILEKASPRIPKERHRNSRKSKVKGQDVQAKKRRLSSRKGCQGDGVQAGGESARN